MPARSLSDSGLIYSATAPCVALPPASLQSCAGGRAAHSSPIFRCIEPLCASISRTSVLALPPCSLRSPESDRLLGTFISRYLFGLRVTRDPAAIARPFAERLDAGILAGLAGFNEANAHTLFVPSDQGIVPNSEHHPRKLDARLESCPKIQHVPYLYMY